MKQFKKKAEPVDHLHAKFYVCAAGEKMGYYPEVEWLTPPLYYYGKQVRFPVDCFLQNEKAKDKLYVNVDGEVHRKNHRHNKKTKYRDEAIKNYCLGEGIRYMTLRVDEVLESQLPDLITMLKLSNENRKLDKKV